ILPIRLSRLADAPHTARIYIATSMAYHTYNNRGRDNLLLYCNPYPYASHSIHTGFHSIMKRIPVRDILWLFIATRLLLLVISYTMYILMTAKNYTSTPVNAIALFTSWDHWDALNYLRIAQYGYQTVYDLAFFPLFPLLIASVSHILGDWSYLLVGTILS